MQKMLDLSKDGDGIELSLELSIGGCYKDRLGKAKNAENAVVAESEKLVLDETNNNNIYDAKGESGPDAMDQQRKREIHALRRQEARWKKAEKQKRSMIMCLSKGMNGVGDDDKAYLEARQFQSRVQDRERRENEMKIEHHFGLKNNNADHVNDLNVSLQYGIYVNGNGNVNEEKNVMKKSFHPVGCRSFRPYQQNGNSSGDFSHISSLGFDSQRNGGKIGQGYQRVVSNGSLERTSSAFSDYQSTSQRGGCCSTDTGSHSNYSQGCQQQLSATATSGTLEKSEINCSSRMDSNQANGKVTNFNMMPASSNDRTPERTEPRKSNLVDNPVSLLQEPTSASSKGSNEAATKPSNPQTHHDQGTTLPKMPLVSTTGNGPNGRTVNGFLYRYTKTEVCIVCVCHGSSFSPAEFVEHAGGVGISHPLKHITILPTFG